MRERSNGGAIVYISAREALLDGLGDEADEERDRDSKDAKEKE